MRTAIDLPDDVVRQLKARAIAEDKSFSALLTEIVCRDLAQQSGRPDQNRITLPLISSGRKALPDEDSPERMAALLLEDGAQPVHGR